MKKLFVFLFLVLYFQSVSYAKFASLGLEDMVRQSDLIVIGTLQDVSTYNGFFNENNQGMLAVDEVIWGDVSVGHPLSVEWNNSTTFACRITFPQNEKAIWMLKINDDGSVTPFFGGHIRLDKKAEVENLLKQKAIENNKHGKPELKLYSKNSFPTFGIVPFSRAFGVFAIALFLFFLLYKRRVKR